MTSTAAGDFVANIAQGLTRSTGKGPACKGLAAWCVAALGALPGGIALGGSDESLRDRPPVSFRHEPPKAAAAAPDDRSTDAPTQRSRDQEPIGSKVAAFAPPPSFGDAGSRWWTVGGGIADNFNDAVDSNLHVAYTYFLAPNIEFTAELAGWYFNQPGDNPVGASAVMLFRWHFINTGAWTVYADTGVGFLAASDNVPDGGTSFDLMPRVGVGFTRQLSESGTRLQMGVRWHHASNARIFGDASNPARDSGMVYAGIIFPF